MRANYILIDFENVQPVQLDALSGEQFRVLIFVGKNQQKLPIALATSVQRLGERAEYVQISGNGRNALDFHIAYYLGVLSEKDPTACYHIVSKDGGFDPLLDFLKGKKCLVTRSANIEEIPVVVSMRKLAQMSFPERVMAYREKLKSASNRPKTLKSLRNSIGAFFQRGLPAEEVEKVVAELGKGGFLLVTDGKVSYPRACPKTGSPQSKGVSGG